jgi:hypothetical protein
MIMGLKEKGKPFHYHHGFSRDYFLLYAWQYLLKEELLKGFQ